MRKAGFGAKASRRPPKRDAVVAPERDLVSGRYGSGGDRSDKHRDTSQPPRQRPRKFLRRGGRGLAAAAALVAIVAVAAVAAVAWGMARPDSRPTADAIRSTPSAAPSSPIPTTSTPTTPVIRLLDPGEAFTGTYRYVQTTTSVKGTARDYVGRTVTRTWTVVANCTTPTNCTAVATSNSGSKFAFAYRDGAWVEDEVMPSMCYDLSNGKELGANTEHATRRLTAGPAKPGMKPAAFAGVGGSRLGAGCPATLASKVTMTRLR